MDSRTPPADKGSERARIGDDVPRRGPVIAFLRRQRDDLIRDALLGVVLALGAFALAVFWDSRAALRQEVLENTRFVRSVAVNGTGAKPFDGLVLQDAVLRGLDLGCEGAEGAEDPLGRSPRNCASFADADLRRADLGHANLRGAQFERADLEGASLGGADLASANLLGARLVEADLGDANLEGATLRAADLSRTSFGTARLRDVDLAISDLRGADLEEVEDLASADLDVACHDETTAWPRGFEPPEPDCAAW